MPIASGDIQFILSGGAANTDPAAALGGARSTAGGGVIATDVLNNVWDNVSGAESASGDIEYRCIYIKNNHGSLQLQSPKIWLSSNTTSADDTVEISLGTSAVNGTEQTISNENTAPSGTSFSAPSSFATGLSLGSLNAGAHKAVWIKRVVDAAAAAANSNSYTLSVQGETAA